MSVVNLYNGIYRVLANDEKVLTYIGIGTGATALQKAKRIQKRQRPQDLVENLPLITFYAPPGKRQGSNLEVYYVQFNFDIYTADNVDLAQRIAGRLLELFDGEIPPMMGVTTFESMFITGHESSTDLANTYCFKVVIQFTISLDKE